MPQRKIQTLVVGLDLSDYSRTVWRQARALADNLSCKIVVVYVGDDSAEYFEIFPQNKAVVRASYEAAIRKKYKVHPDHKVEIRFGRPYVEITAVAKTAPHPLVLVGHRSQNAVSRFFLGSTAERLALTSPFPVWIHRGQSVVLAKKVLVPCDLSSRSENTIQGLRALETALKTRSDLYHVSEEPVPLLDYHQWTLAHDRLKTQETRRFARLKKSYPRLQAERSTGNVVSQIHKRAKTSDLIALSPRHHGGPIPSFGSVTSKLIRSGTKPILVVP